LRRGCVHPQRPGALPFLNHDKGVWTEFGLKGADALRVNGGPALDAPLLGVNRRAQLPTGVLLRAGLSPGVKVLDLKERPRYRRCGRKCGPSFRSSGGGRDSERAPRPPRLDSIAVCPEKRQSSSDHGSIQRDHLRAQCSLRGPVGRFGEAHAFISRFNSLRNCQSVPSAMIFWGLDLIIPASCNRSA